MLKFKKYYYFCLIKIKEINNQKRKKHEKII